MKLKIEQIPAKIFWVSLIFCTIYTWYRYPFKLGTSTTSPTYADTPFAIQIFKFILVLIFCIMAGPWALKTPIKRGKVALVISVVFLQITCLIKAIYSFDVAYIDQTFWSMAAVIMVLSIRNIAVKDVDRFFRFLLVFSIATNAIELALFLTAGRLPAQGYPNSIIVRFGGWLDAPNDFACLLFLLMGWIFYRYSGKKRILISGLLVICLLLTQSLTAYAFLLAMFLFMGIAHVVRRPLSILWLGVFLVLLVVLIKIMGVQIISNILEDKQGSIQGHLRSPAEWLDNWWQWVLIGVPERVFFEDWWLSSLLNLGALWFGICVATMGGLLYSIASQFRHATDRIHKSLLSGILLFSVYCILGSLNLPFFTYFPVNYFFYLFCLLVFLGKLRVSSEVGLEHSLNRVPGTAIAEQGSLAE